VSSFSTVIDLCMQDLQEVTGEVHYENYRLQKLAAEARAGVKAELSGGHNVSSSVCGNVNDSVDGESTMARILQEKEAELRKMQELMAKMQMEMSMKK
jgi:septin 2